MGSAGNAGITDDLFPKRQFRTRLLVRLVSVLALVLASSLVLAQAAQAVALTQLNSESFTNANTTDTNWRRPSAGTNTACLTAGSNVSQTPIPGCQSPAIDSVGSGQLRLTSNLNGQVGTVYSTVSLPTAQGLDIKFNSYQYNGSGADGIAFLLAVTDPANPAAPVTSGPLGGSLGYSASGVSPGVSYGYIGFGVDVFGNFSNSNFGGTGCPITAAVPESVTVRGPGNGTAGYCILSTTSVGAGGLDKAGQSARPAAVPIEIALNPSGSAANTGTLAVPANSWAMKVGAYTGTTTLSGALPSVAPYAPASWFDSATGQPYQLTFGWAASTGGSNEIHEISTLTSSTVNGQLPAYQLAATDNANDAFIAGNQATVSITPSLRAGEGSESRAPTITTTFPAGITPQAGPFTTNGYTCTSTAQVTSCTYTPGSAIAAGTNLPTADIPVTIGSGTTPGSYTIRSQVSSTDANPATTTLPVTVSSFVASASGTISYGANETLSFTGIPSGATGAVTFKDAGNNTLCAVPDVTAATSCVVTAPHGGSYAVTATYAPGASSPYATQDATTSFTVNKAGAPFTAAATPAAAAFGASSTLLASGLPAGATGTVVFKDASNNELCTVADVTIATSCSTAADLALGSYSITATYSGDTNYNASTAATSLTVGQATNTLTAAVSDPSITYGSTDTLSFSGLPTAGATAATGTVTFKDAGLNVLCTATLPSTSCSTATTLAAGVYAVTAFYSGDPHYAAVNSVAVPMTVTKAPITLTASATSPVITYGDADTLSFAGLPTTGGNAATGTVTFTDAASNVLCVAILPATSCSTSTALPAGSYTVTATYAGDANYDAGAATSFPITVGQHGATGLVADVTPPSTAYANAATLSYSGLTLTGPNAATGTVTFADASHTTLCTATLPATSCVAPDDLDTGHYGVTASYSGDSNYAASTATTAFDVTSAPTALVAAVSDNSVSFGSADTLSYSGLTVSGPTAATGTVTFSAAGTTLCTATLPATSCSTPADLAAGHYPVTATYSGDGNHDGSSAGTAFEVAQAATAISTAASTAGHFGTVTTLAYGGLPVTGTTAATGTVVFTDAAGDVLCTATLPETSCAVDAAFGAGDYDVTATYSGDANHLGSTASGALHITTASFVMVATPSVAKATLGQPVVITLSGIPDDATGTVTVTSKGHTLCTIVLPALTCTTSKTLAIGDYPLVASYLGDDNYNPSTATASFAVIAIPHTFSKATAKASATGSKVTLSVPTGNGVVVTITDAPAHGTAFIRNGKLFYTAADGYSGPDTITYLVVRADGSSEFVTVTIDVPSIPGVAAAAPSAELSDTGVDVRTPLIVGAGFIGAGVLAVAGTRRRSRA
ncbi:MAG: hypothetical protein JWN95_2766 [Frankiales bacterium]|nr:hypothetical protein [Frankiales bacterium]